MTDAGSLIHSYIVMQNRNKSKKEISIPEPINYDAILTPDQKKILSQLESELNKENPIHSEHQCPECGKNFTLITINNIELDVCVFCKSYWFDSGELAKMTGVKQDVPSQTLRHRSSKYTCPICNEIMNEYVFLQPHNLLVDKCPNGHGVYLESGELKRAFVAATTTL